MDYRQLEMLLAVAESAGYTKAGEQLHVSPR
jgi:DNA-binding transcriptional LysR family regulator